jgi:hypothetical protein
MRALLLALLLIAAPLADASARVGLIEANDTGGIIAWSPQSARLAHAIAHDHCARYGKVSRITSVNARYGNYIGFACQFPNIWRHHRRGVVLRARY